MNNFNFIKISGNDDAKIISGTSKKYVITKSGKIHEMFPSWDSNLSSVEEGIMIDDISYPSSGKINLKSCRLEFPGYSIKYCLVSRLVAQAFIPNPNNYKFVRFINGNKSDVFAENLYWAESSTSKYSVSKSKNQQSDLQQKVISIPAGNLFEKSSKNKEDIKTRYNSLYYNKPVNRQPVFHTDDLNLAELSEKLSNMIKEVETSCTENISKLKNDIAKILSEYQDASKQIDPKKKEAIEFINKIYSFEGKAVPDDENIYIAAVSPDGTLLTVSKYIASGYEISPGNISYWKSNIISPWRDDPASNPIFRTLQYDEIKFYKKSFGISKMNSTNISITGSGLF